MSDWSRRLKDEADACDKYGDAAHTFSADEFRQIARAFDVGNQGFWRGFFIGWGSAFVGGVIAVVWMVAIHALPC